MSWLDRALLVLVVALPVTAAMWRLTGAAQWRSDLATVRDQALVAVGFGGTLSTVVTQALGIFPLGSLHFRASLGSALALALAAFFVWRITRRVLSGPEFSPSLVSLLSAVGAAGAASSPTWQQEATVGGGAMFAVAAALAAVDLVLALTAPKTPTLTPAGGRRWLLLGVVTGLACGESLPTGLALLIAVPVACTGAGKRPPRSIMWLSAAVFATTVALLAAPLLLRSLAPSSWSDLGRALSATSLAALGVAGSHVSALRSWLGELGWICLGFAGLGMATGLWHRYRRHQLSPLIILMAVDIVYPMTASAGLQAQPLVALRVLALGAFAVCSALGVAQIVRYLVASKVPMARAAAALTVVFYLTAVAVTSEEASFSADRSEHFGAEEWTDSALSTLPVRAAVLVHTPALAWRLWAAKLGSGQRPDVVVIPAALLSRAQMMSALLPSEPAILPLLRDFALKGQATEYSLSFLADSRPLHVDLDPVWDQRLVSHLYIDGVWLRYAPEVLGRSDRQDRGRGMLALDSRIVREISAGDSRDDSSTAVVVRAIKQQAAALSLLGMTDSARLLVDRIEGLGAADGFVTAARLRLAYADRRRGHRVELRDLLRF